MPKATSLLDLKFSTIEPIARLFKLADGFSQGHAFVPAQKAVVSLVFFEPSTRTRLSFEMACHRLGYSAMVFDKNSSSLEKGETLEDSLLNIDALKPNAIIVRSGDDLNQEQVCEQLKSPMINAGWGKRGHPSQALLDAFTIRQKHSNFQEVRILFLGDLKHSRVLASHLELSECLGYKTAGFAPDELMLGDSRLIHFSKLNEALAWANVVMCLRVQSERHSNAVSIKNFNLEFGMNSVRLSQLPPETMIMHPGPINHGIEMSTDVLNDSRSYVLQQVTNGVFIRQAILRSFIERDVI